MWVRAQRLVDGDGVGVQVEHPADPRDGRGDVGQRGELEGGPQAPARGRRGRDDLDGAGAVREGERPGVAQGAVVDVGGLHPADRASGEEAERAQGVEGLAHGQVQIEHHGGGGRGRRVREIGPGPVRAG